jgi:hypothetical protein
MTDDRRQKTDNRGQKLEFEMIKYRAEDRGLKSEMGIWPPAHRGIRPTPRREVGKIGREMSSYIFTQSTYSTLSTQSTIYTRNP